MVLWLGTGTLDFYPGPCSGSRIFHAITSAIRTGQLSLSLHNFCVVANFSFFLSPRIDSHHITQCNFSFFSYYLWRKSVFVVAATALTTPYMSYGVVQSTMNCTFLQRVMILQDITKNSWIFSKKDVSLVFDKNTLKSYL